MWELHDVIRLVVICYHHEQILTIVLSNEWQQDNTREGSVLIKKKASKLNTQDFCLWRQRARIPKGPVEGHSETKVKSAWAERVSRRPAG